MPPFVHLCSATCLSPDARRSSSTAQSAAARPPTRMHHLASPVEQLHCDPPPRLIRCPPGWRQSWPSPPSPSSLRCARWAMQRPRATCTGRQAAWQQGWLLRRARCCCCDAQSGSCGLRLCAGRLVAGSGVQAAACRQQQQAQASPRHPRSREVHRLCSRAWDVQWLASQSREGRGWER